MDGWTERHMKERKRAGERENRLSTSIVNSIMYSFPMWGFPGGSDDGESACNAGDPGSISWLGRSPREGDGYPFQYSCLENSMDREVWWATVHGVTKSWT